jgi:hypothetical protein
MTIVNDFFNRLEGTWKNKLDGNWQESFGWNFISQPILGDPKRGDFNMRFDQMLETIEFTKLSGPPARNVGITGEAGFWEGMKYEVNIGTPAGEGIHQEMGHFLLNVDESGNSLAPFAGTILRQATIPRANAFMTMGTLTPGAITDVLGSPDPFYSAKPEARTERRQAKLDPVFTTTNDEIIAAGGPNFNAPLEFVADILADNRVGIDWVFSFRDESKDSKMINGQQVIDAVRVGKLFSDFWIGTRMLNGQEIEILQYAQLIDLKFSGVHWPHVAVNTLVKQPVADNTVVDNTVAEQPWNR